MKSTKQVAKVADIRYRVELKEHPGIVVYIVRSSDDSEDYQVTLRNGKVSSCTCKAHDYGHIDCYVKRDVQAAEDARKPEQPAIVKPVVERSERGRLRGELNMVNGIPMR